MEHRTLVDSQGVVWDIWEVQAASNEQRRAAAPVPPEGTPERRGSRSQRSPRRAGWLAIQNATERRRVVPAPDDWREMTDDQLGAVVVASAGTGRPLDLAE